MVSLWTGSLSLKVALGIGATLPIHCLGYGENHNWLERLIYAFGLSLPTLIISFNWWIIFPPVIFISTWILSNNKKTAGLFNWRICEFLVGASVGILWSQILC